MPCSEHFGKDIIKKWLDSRKDIKTIVDVGPGQGTYPKILGPKYKYTGIEIWAPYIDEFNLHDLYDKLIIADVRYVVWPRGDCVIFGDVLEHLVKEDAIKVLKVAEKKYNHVVISVPIGLYMQGGSHGNKYEAHLSSWEFEELQSLFKDYKVKEKIEHIGIFIK